jgi:transposase-like protein
VAKQSSETIIRWQAVLQKWQQSGQSVATFCRSHRISIPSLYAWRKKLQVKPRPAPKFLPVHITPSPSALIEILLPNGLRLKAPCDIDASRLAKLVLALQGQPC